MSETRVLSEIEAACAHHKICVLPRNPNSMMCSVWDLADLEYHVGIIWRCNTGALKAGRRFIRFGLPGIPDFEGWRFKDGRRLTIEAKSAKGSLTPDQRAYAYLAERSNILAGVVRSYDECATLLKTWGF
jgi:hypothetical protein